MVNLSTSPWYGIVRRERTQVVGGIPQGNSRVAFGREMNPMADEQIAAVALLTKQEVDRIGHDLRRVYPVEQTHRFRDLLRAIDDAYLRRGTKLLN
jgi:hypothetical protein